MIPINIIPRHHGGNGGHASLMPANASVDDGGPCSFNGLRQLPKKAGRIGLRLLPGSAAASWPHLDNFFPCAAVFHQVQHAEAIDDDKVFADALSDFPHNFHGQSNAILVAAA